MVGLIVTTNRSESENNKRCNEHGRKGPGIFCALQQLYGAHEYQKAFRADRNGKRRHFQNAQHRKKNQLTKLMESLQK